MDNNWDDKNHRDDLSFMDSWKSKDVELAAGTAIIVGAGVLGAKGKLPDVGKYGKQALKQAEKGFDRYIKRNGHPIIRNGYVVGSGVLKNLRKATVQKPGDVYEEIMSKSRAKMGRINEDVLKKKTDDRYDELLKERNGTMARAKSMGDDIPDIAEPDYIKVQEEVRQEMLDKMDAPKVDYQGQPKRDPFFNKKDMVSNFVGSGIAAVGFGAGITAFHAANNALSEKDKDRDKLFEAAGSSYKPDERRNRQMNKQAGVREVHDSLAGLAGNVPKAVATGLGFTGVSLGSAHLLNKNKQEESNKNRIIIELGEDDPMNRSNSSHATAGGLSMLPKPEFSKSAGFQSFLKNIGGRSTETSALDQKMKNFDYNTAAANSLRGKDVDGMAKNQFGHLFNDEKAKEQLRDMHASRLKNADQATYDQIKTEVARDRLIGAGGLGIAGIAGGAAAVNQKRKDEQNGQQPIY